MIAAISERNPSEESQWHLFNDFLVRQVTKDEALRFVQSWKMPVILTYQIKSARHAIDDSWKDSLETACLYYNWSMKWVFLLPLPLLVNQ
jgi:PAB-dependent poly(A)-specific ribonuclease subunit 2